MFKEKEKEKEKRSGILKVISLNFSNNYGEGCDCFDLWETIRRYVALSDVVSSSTQESEDESYSLLSKRSSDILKSFCY